MHIQSTNSAESKTILWHGKEETTGIYKTPTTQPIYLGKKGVKDDYIGDTKAHGGIHKACYLFSTNHYPYWKKLYPELKWNWGMFGENLTVNGMDETKMMIGDVYKIGNALVQVSQPREPCFKFGIKFGNQEVIKQFIDHGFSGTYVSVLEEGLVSNTDSFKLIERWEQTLSVAQLYHLIFAKTKDQELLKIAVDCAILPKRKREKLRSFLK